MRSVNGLGATFGDGQTDTHKYIFLSVAYYSTLNFRGREKTKKAARDICRRSLDIKFERDRSIGLGSTFGDGQSDKHIEIFFIKHFFRMWE